MFILHSKFITNWYNTFRYYKPGQVLSGTEHSKTEQVNLWKTAFKKILAVFHKFHLVHSWILCRILNWSSTLVQNVNLKVMRKKRIEIQNFSDFYFPLRFMSFMSLVFNIVYFITLNLCFDETFPHILKIYVFETSVHYFLSS